MMSLVVERLAVKIIMVNYFEFMVCGISKLKYFGLLKIFNFVVVYKIISIGNVRIKR